LAAQNTNDKPAVIVLCMVGTGMATVRALAAQSDLEIHAVIFQREAPISYSRYCKKIYLDGAEKNEARLLEFLLKYSQQLGNRPVVLPCSDAHALFLAIHYEALAPHCRIWTTSYRDLLSLVDKTELYRIAAYAGIDTIPAIANPTLAQLAQWCQSNAAPYLLKPAYEGIESSRLAAKNLLIASPEKLLAYVSKHGAEALIIQRMIKGGDGHIFDCYGLCDSGGRVVTLASHRRWRQHHPDFGVTCFGEIPANLPNGGDRLLFEKTSHLLSQLKYHGIFGVEWLHDQATGKFYVIDFNARPFTSIGHLMACGLNLPQLAYRELIGDELADVELTPRLKTKYWVDLLKDIESFNDKRAKHAITFYSWFRSLLRCRSSAYWDWRDPGPGLYALMEIGARTIGFLQKKLSKPTATIDATKVAN
jgi:predicted ATP-grasp superfamily ATP-dependent carboligase